jgi:hypothetical protein
MADTTHCCALKPLTVRTLLRWQEPLFGVALCRSMKPADAAARGLFSYLINQSSNRYQRFNPQSYLGDPSMLDGGIYPIISCLPSSPLTYPRSLSI